MGLFALVLHGGCLLVQVDKLAEDDLMASLRMPYIDNQLWVLLRVLRLNYHPLQHY
jgi:hypothetical protein